MQNPPTQNDAQKTTNFHAKRSTLEDKEYDICSTYQDDSCFTEAQNSIAFISQDSGTKISLLLTIYHKFKTKLRIIPHLNKFESRRYNNQNSTYENDFLFIVLIIAVFSLSRNVSFKCLPIALIAFKHFANVTIRRFIANKILSVSFLTFY